MDVEDDNMAHDQYDFMLQFSCYVLADSCKQVDSNATSWMRFSAMESSVTRLT